MSDLRQYSKQFLTEFIEMYKSHPTLWQIKNKEYRDRIKKNAAYDLLIRKCKEVEPDSTKDTVVKKINSLRTCYRKEFKKVQTALREGDVYQPRLWYYDLLTFLNEEVLLNDSIYLGEDITSEFPGSQFDPLTSQNESQSESARSSPIFTPSDVPPQQKKRHLKEDTSASVVEKREEDEFDLLGKLYANKLRRLKSNQRIFAEKIINDTLFEAQLGNLSRRCALVTHVRNEVNEPKVLNGVEIDLKQEYLDTDSADTSFID